MVKTCICEMFFINISKYQNYRYDNCLQINVPRTLLKINPPFVQVHLMTWCTGILLCDRTVVADPSAISRLSVGAQSATDWRSVSDWLATVSWAFVFDCRKSATFWRSVGDWSAISRQLKTVPGLFATTATGQRSVTNQSATCQQPPKTFLRSIWSQRGFACSNQTSLRSNRPCNLLQPVGDQSPTSLQPPCDHPKFWSQGGCRPVASYVWPGLKAGLFMLKFVWWWFASLSQFHITQVQIEKKEKK